MNRKQRRALNRAGKKAGLKDAAAQLGTAMDALKGVEGVGEAIKTIEAAQKQVAETALIVDALVDDYQRLADEQELQREVMIQLLLKMRRTIVTNNVDYEGWLREREAEIRQRATAKALEATG